MASCLGIFVQGVVVHRDMFPWVNSCVGRFKVFFSGVWLSWSVFIFPSHHVWRNNITILICIGLLFFISFQSYRVEHPKTDFHGGSPILETLEEKNTITNLYHGILRGIKLSIFEIFYESNFNAKRKRKLSKSIRSFTIYFCCKYFDARS